jgi:hypothetical protein
MGKPRAGNTAWRISEFIGYVAVSWGTETS